MPKAKILLGMVGISSLLVMSVFCVKAGFGGVTDAIIVPTNNTESTAPGITTLSFDIANSIPIGGQIQLNLPTEFTADDIANATGNLTLTAGSATIASASLASHVLSVTTATAAIPASGSVELVMDASVIDLNPSSAGYYGFQITTLDAGSLPIDTGIAFLHVGAGIPIATEVEQVLIFGTDDSSLSFSVNPTVNDGLDNSQSSALAVSTNALSYSITGELTNTHNSNNSLYSNYGFEIPTSDTESANTLSVNLTGANTEGNLGLDGDYLVSNADGLGVDLTTNIYYRLKVDSSIPEGTYAGSVMYTVFPTF